MLLDLKKDRKKDLKKAAFLGFCVSLVICATIQTSAAQEDFHPALTNSPPASMRQIFLSPGPRIPKLSCC